MSNMSSQTGGVKAFSIQGRLYRERERLLGMTDEERAWRAKWVKDQNLAKSEPIYNPELYKELYNPIRRFYRMPLDSLKNAITPIVGETNAFYIRYLSGKFLMAVAVAYAGVYYFKYNANDWTRKSGWRVIPSKFSVLPGDPGYPAKDVRTSPADYGSRNFKSSPI